MKRIYLSEDGYVLRQALTEEGRLIEYAQTDRRAALVPGMILIGCIQELVPSLEAAFVNIGTGKPAFLPLDGRSLSRFHAGEELPLLVKKLPVGEKGAELSDVLELAGRFLVLNERKGIGVSSRITDEAVRAALRKQAEAFPGTDRVGYIVRTEAQTASPEELITEAGSLLAQYEQIVGKAVFRTVGTMLYEPLPPWVEWIGREGAASLTTDSSVLARQLRESYPKLEISLFSDGRFSLFDFSKISSQLEKALMPKLFLEGGGYVFIEQTNALVAVDVNTAKGKGSEKEKTVFETNKKAAKLIFEQLRLRNLSGMILIDFVNMKDESNRKELLAYAGELAANDPMSIRLYGYTSLGLMELSRRRSGQTLKEMLEQS